MMRRLVWDIIIIVALSILAFTCMISVPIQAQGEVLPQPIACWIADGFLAVLYQGNVLYYVAVIGNDSIALHPALPTPWSHEALFAMCDPEDPLYVTPPDGTDPRLSPNGYYLAYFELYQGPGAGYYYLVIWANASSTPLQIAPNFIPN